MLYPTKRRRQAVPVGATQGSAGVGYKAEGEGGTLGKNFYCGFYEKNEQGRVNRIRIG